MGRKYIPIDVKMISPDKLKEPDNNEIKSKYKTEIKNIKKYKNLTNTIDSCIMVVPSEVFYILKDEGEISNALEEHNIYICTPEFIHIIAHLISRVYNFVNENDIEKIKQEYEKHKEAFRELKKTFDKFETPCNQVNKAKEIINKALS